MAVMQLKLTCVFSLITLLRGREMQIKESAVFSRRILSNCVKQVGKDVFGLIKLTKQKKRTVGMLNRQMARLGCGYISLLCFLFFFFPFFLLIMPCIIYGS